MSGHELRIHSTFPAVIAAAVAAGSAWAQTTGITARATCLSAAANMVEPLGDTDGHTLGVSEGTCQVTAGPLEGSVQSSVTIWEYKKGGGGTLVAGHFVSRRPGDMGVVAYDSATMTFQRQDGKVTGWTIAGKGHWVSGVGVAAAYVGKSFAWTARSTSSRSYVVESVFD